MSDDMTQRDQIFDTSADLQEIVELDLVQVQPDPNQPRIFFDEENLEELAASIRAHGQLVPILVRPDPQGERSYIIIGGERRFRAFERLGLERIQAIIKRVDEKQARELALVDNLQGVDLSPLEEAAGYARLIEEFDLTQEDVAERVGKSRTYVTGALALNRLPEKVKEEARSANVSKSKLVELAQLGDAQRQLSLWEKLKKGITVAEARQAKQREAERGPGKSKVDKTKIQFPETLKTGRQFTQQLERVDPEYYRSRPKDLSRVVELYERLGRHLESVRQAMAEPAAEAVPEPGEIQESVT